MSGSNVGWLLSSKFRTGVHGERSSCFRISCYQSQPHIGASIRLERCRCLYRGGQGVEVVSLESRATKLCVTLPAFLPMEQGELRLPIRAKLRWRPTHSARGLLPPRPRQALPAHGQASKPASTSPAPRRCTARSCGSGWSMRSRRCKRWVMDRRLHCRRCDRIGIALSVAPPWESRPRLHPGITQKVAPNESQRDPKAEALIADTCCAFETRAGEQPPQRWHQVT
jgi:hypothetical protein